VRGCGVTGALSFVVRLVLARGWRSFPTRNTSLSNVHERVCGVNGYRRYPAPGPSRRAAWLLIVLVVVMLVANLVDQGGIW